MAKRPVVTSISSGYASTTTLNDNFAALVAAFDNTLSRDGSTPNTMDADLDLNGNDILNVNSLTDSSGKDILVETKTNADAAEAAKTAAEAALDEFTDLYLGSKDSAPTADNDGDSLQVGALYFNSTDNKFQVYNGTEFGTAVESIPATGLPVSQGGTGATTPEQALINLGAGTTDEALALAIALG